MNTFPKQFRTLKEKYKDAILIFRTSESYEAFGDDAEILSNVIGIELNDIENAEIRHSVSLSVYALDKTLSKLVKSGYKVGICEELQHPEKTKDVARRRRRQA